MKTWRERIVEAKERGKFSKEDRQDAWHADTCAVGETLCLGPFSDENAARYERFEGAYGYPGNLFTNAVTQNDFAGAEAALDQIEDAALQFKREQP